MCVSKDQKNVMVSVQDFGIGIGEAHQQKIFERFYQLVFRLIRPERAWIQWLLKLEMCGWVLFG